VCIQAPAIGSVPSIAVHEQQLGSAVLIERTGAYREHLAPCRSARHIKEDARATGRLRRARSARRI